MSLPALCKVDVTEDKGHKWKIGEEECESGYWLDQEEGAESSGDGTTSDSESPRWVLGTELGSSGRTTSALHR